MGVSIQFRRGTATEWTSADPTLLAGELGIETDTNKFKVGDGSTAWTGLDYISSVDAHALDHAVGGTDTVFPADPGADRYLMWDDGPGELAWAESVGGDITTDGEWAAKGDLIVGTGENTAAILTAGDNGKYLKAASGEATGLVWDTPSGSGDVTAAAVITEHSVVRGDGGAKGIQDTAIIVDDSDNVSGVASIVVTGHVHLFDDGGEYIGGDGTDLTVTSSAKINLTAVSDIILPVNVGLILGDGAEKIESDNTDLTINSGGAINLTATTDVVIPANVGVTFGTGEKIEGDGTDLTITSSGVLNLNSTGALNASHQAITDNHVLTVDDAAAADDDYARFTASGIEGIPRATAITDLLSVALPEDTTIILDAVLSADEHWSGISMIGTMGYTTAVGDLVYLAVGDSRWEKAKADAVATCKGLLGICLAAGITDGNTAQILLYGKIRSAVFPALTVGAPVYISTATAGLVTATMPTKSTGQIVRIVGYGITAEDLMFCPDKTYIEYA
jgi:hypothetical protein